MRRGRGFAAWPVVMLLLTGCGETADASDDRSCSEVAADLEEPSRIRAETFGGGPEGRDAMATIVGTIEARPDCFSEQDLEFARELSETLPSEAQAEAMTAAEDACAEDVEGASGGGPDPDAPGYARPEAALTNGTGLWPEGSHELAVEDDSWVRFDYHDDQGEYRGAVMVEQVDDSWFVRWVMTCLAVTP